MTGPLARTIVPGSQHCPEPKFLTNTVLLTQSVASFSSPRLGGINICLVTIRWWRSDFARSNCQGPSRIFFTNIFVLFENSYRSDLSWYSFCFSHWSL